MKGEDVADGDDIDGRATYVAGRKGNALVRSPRRGARLLRMPGGTLLARWRERGTLIVIDLERRGAR